MIQTPGTVRPGLELAVLGLGAWALKDLGYSGGALAMGSTILVHYVVSIGRVRWLLQQ